MIRHATWPARKAIGLALDVVLGKPEPPTPGYHRNLTAPATPPPAW